MEKHQINRPAAVSSLLFSLFLRLVLRGRNRRNRKVDHNESDKVYITIVLPDAKDVKLSLQPDGHFHFSATTGADNVAFEIVIKLMWMKAKLLLDQGRYAIL
ncbi:putative HSP20-like chaperone [Dioscorea sansibarensis]